MTDFLYICNFSVKPVTIGFHLLVIAMNTANMVHVAKRLIIRNSKRITDMENWVVGSLSQFFILRWICKLEDVISLLVKVKCSALELSKDVVTGSQLSNIQILFLTLHGVLSQNLNKRLNAQVKKRTWIALTQPFIGVFYFQNLKTHILSYIVK